MSEGEYQYHTYLPLEGKNIGFRIRCGDRYWKMTEDSDDFFTSSILPSIREGKIKWEDVTSSSVNVEFRDTISDIRHNGGISIEDSRPYETRLLSIGKHFLDGVSLHRKLMKTESNESDRTHIETLENMEEVMNPIIYSLAVALNVFEPNECDMILSRLFHLTQDAYMAYLSLLPSLEMLWNIATLDSMAQFDENAWV